MLVEWWFRAKKRLWLLWPLSFLYRVLSRLRKYLYKQNFLSSYSSSLPVIVVGNISVGGSGKTPVCLWLAKLLKDEGYQPVILSRGYGGNATNFPHLVTSLCSAELVGDEPALFARREICPVVIDPKRARGAQFIETEQLGNVIICDDGLQHYALQRDIEICVLDPRGFGNGRLLPMGPLREGVSRLSQVDSVIVHQHHHMCDQVLSVIDGKTKGSLSLEPMHFVNLQTNAQVSLDAFKPQTKCTAIAGIGNPQRFFDTLTKLKINCHSYIRYPDHHQFSADNIPADACVLMTEKDAVKCQEFAHDDCWYLQVEAELTGEIKRDLFKKLAIMKR